MITERQEKILQILLREYLTRTKPVSSLLLKKVSDFNVSPATIRNDLQKLTQEGYIRQPHTSAGRVPTLKAYQYIIDKIFEREEKILMNFLRKEIRRTQLQLRKELKTAERLRKNLKKLCQEFKVDHSFKKENFCNIILKIERSRIIYKKSIQIINNIIKELEGF
mgnify:CR=1 FL=1